MTEFHKHLIYVYECNLEIPAWSNLSELYRANRYRPRMVFLRELGGPELLIQISIWADKKLDDDRWMVQFYPLGGKDELREGEDNVFWSMKRHPPRRLEPTLERGELRHPRTTTTDAIRFALELLADVVPKTDLAGLGKLAEMHRPTLERVTKAYLMQFRPKR